MLDALKQQRKSRSTAYYRAYDPRRNNRLTPQYKV